MTKKTFPFLLYGSLIAPYKVLLAIPVAAICGDEMD